MSHAIRYERGIPLNVEEVRELYRASTLGERRPSEDLERLQQMLDGANLVITAWDGERLVGIARTMTDFSYAAYLSDLAVDLDYQRAGIGKELIRRTQRALDPRAKLILLSAPAAVEYYPKLGFAPHHSAWVIPADKEIP